jgi:transcriptional regulator GlxA family with amidase domain
MLKELGFRTDAPESTGHALILNLIRSTYGEAAAQEAARELLLLRNRPVTKSSEELGKEFQESPAISESSEPIQLSLFDRKLG